MKRLTCLCSFVMAAIGLGCSKPELASCDITQRTCQETIYFHLLSLRGDGYDPFGGLPPVKVISEDAFRTQLEEDAAKTAAQGPNPWDKALTLLHFTTAPGPNADGGASSDGGSSTIDDEVAHIYAFYDPATKRVTVISHPSGGDTAEEAMITLAHELVHALQDKELDLASTDFRTTDSYFANSCVVEGDARFYENLFRKDVRTMLGQTSSDVLTWPDLELDWDYEHFDQLGTAMFAARALWYPLGAKYEATEYRNGGNAAIRHGYARAPGRTVGFLVGPDGVAPPVGSGNVCPSPYVSSLPTSRTAGADQLGALLFYTFLRGWGVDHTTAFATAQAWTGDYLRMQASGDYATTAVSWRIELARPPSESIVQKLTATHELAASADSESLQINVSDAATTPQWTKAPCQ